MTTFSIVNSNEEIGILQYTPLDVKSNKMYTKIWINWCSTTNKTLHCNKYEKVYNLYTICYFLNYSVKLSIVGNENALNRGQTRTHLSNNHCFIIQSCRKQSKMDSDLCDSTRVIRDVLMYSKRSLTSKSSLTGELRLWLELIEIIYKMLFPLKVTVRFFLILCLIYMKVC